MLGLILANYFPSLSSGLEVVGPLGGGFIPIKCYLPITGPDPTVTQLPTPVKS
jgi:hypothetical protein